MSDETRETESETVNDKFQNFWDESSSLLSATRDLLDREMFRKPGDVSGLFMSALGRYLAGTGAEGSGAEVWDRLGGYLGIMFAAMFDCQRRVMAEQEEEE